MLPPLPVDYEIELKLRVRPEERPRFEVPSLLREWHAGAPESRTLESVYFETPDHLLVQRRIGLRVRKSGNHYLQTLKEAGDPSTGMGRREWEYPLPPPEAGVPIRPDPERITAPQARELLAGIPVERLAPFFITRIERRIQMLALEHRGEACRVEMAFDHGTLVLPHDGRSLPLCEIELELKQGHPGVLYRIARVLHAIAPLELERMTKAARGYALARGDLPLCCKAQKLEISAGTTLRQTVAAVVRACLAHAESNQPCARLGQDSEGVHQMRVGVRRLRSALTVFKPVLPADEREILRSGLKNLANGLGPARDWDVFLSELLPPVEAAFATIPGNSADLALLRSVARQCREAAYAELRDVLAAPQYTALMLHCGQWLEDWCHTPEAEPLPETGTPGSAQAETAAALCAEPVGAWAPVLLTRRHKQARRMGANFARLDSERRHQVRIALKKLRYTADFFRSLYEEKPVRRYLQELSALQDQLGHLNDVATAHRLLDEARRSATGKGGLSPAAQHALNRACGLVEGWHARGVAEREAALIQDWEGFAAAKPFWPKPEKG